MHEFEWRPLSAFQCQTVDSCACVSRLKTSESVGKYIGFVYSVKVVYILYNYIPRQCVCIALPT